MMSFLKDMFSGNSPGSSVIAGRATPLPTAERHAVFGRLLKEPRPDGMEYAMFGMGCFWGVERIFWHLDGVWNTAAGYAGGTTPNPTYREVCTGRTGHNEVVRLVFDPSVVSYDELLRSFWEGHDPTQGMRQGADVGTQYRSGIYTYSDSQERAAGESLATYQRHLRAAGFSAITTEILPAPEFYFAEDYHQQYLVKNPSGYCGVGGTGVRCDTGLIA